MSEILKPSRLWDGILSAVMCLLGIASFVLVICLAGKLTPTCCMALMVAGTALLLFGIYKLFTIFIFCGKTA